MFFRPIFKSLRKSLAYHFLVFWGTEATLRNCVQTCLCHFFASYLGRRICPDLWQPSRTPCSWKHLFHLWLSMTTRRRGRRQDNGKLREKRACRIGAGGIMWNNWDFYLGVGGGGGGACFVIFVQNIYSFTLKNQWLRIKSGRTVPEGLLRDCLNKLQQRLRLIKSPELKWISRTAVMYPTLLKTKLLYLACGEKNFNVRLSLSFIKTTYSMDWQYIYNSYIFPTIERFSINV